MIDDAPRSRAARRAAERALVRVIHHYGARPEFVVIGGLVPELLCGGSEFKHAGTTDIDVQVDLEIACGSVNTERLERALRNAEFEPDGEHIWRWNADDFDRRMVIKFEFLADLEDVPQGEFKFDNSDALGASNLRGTGFASRDVEVRELRTRIGGTEQIAEVNVTGLAGFLLAKCAAAHSRGKTKDWYDIAFVLLHNDAGGPTEAAQAVKGQFGSELASAQTALRELLANFEILDAQGTRAYAEQMMIDHPELDRDTLLAEAVVAIQLFCSQLLSSQLRTV